MAFMEFDARDRSERRFLHVSLEQATVAVQCIEFGSNRLSTLYIIRSKTFDAERHVGESSCGIDAWRKREAQVMDGGALRIAGRDPEQCRESRLHAAGA